jgi:hypothetical protein
VNRFLRSFFVLLILLAGSFALVGGTGYAEPGGFDVPKVNEDFDQFEHTPAPQKQQPIHNTEVQAEEKGFWDKTAEFFKDGWEWVSEKGSEFIHWTKEKVADFLEAFEKILSLLTSVVIVVGSFFKGLGKALWDALKGIADIIAHPIETLKNLFYAIAHPIDTIKAIWQSISESFIRDVIHGDAKSRAEWFGYALGEIVLAVVGTKGADKVGKMARASKLARKGSGLLEKLPAPIQKVFTKDFWKNAASTLSSRLNINWKNAEITGVAGTALTVLGYFGIPKIAPAAMKVYKKLDCLVYEQPADSYVAMMLLPNGGHCESGGGNQTINLAQRNDLIKNTPLPNQNTNQSYQEYFEKILGKKQNSVTGKDLALPDSLVNIPGDQLRKWMEDGRIRAANPHDLDNYLKNFKNITVQVDSNIFISLDKNAMKHILESHHPKYFNPKVRTTRSGDYKDTTLLPSKMSEKDVEDVLTMIIIQEKENIRKNARKPYNFQVGKINAIEVDGIQYVVGFKDNIYSNGKAIRRVGQFYPKVK